MGGGRRWTLIAALALLSALAGALPYWLPVLLPPLLLVAAVRLSVGPAERQLTALREKLADETRTDGLTGLLNRGAFAARLARMLSDARPGRHLGLIVIDLHWLREANAAQGQAAGDALLREAAERLRRCMRPGDAIGRLGGDEFAVAVADLPDAATATALAARVREALHAGPVSHTGRTLRLGATLGLAVAPDGEAAPGTVPGAEALLAAAFGALARAKGNERGTLAVSSAADRQRAARESELLRSLGAADATLPGGGLDRLGLYAALQPQLRLSDGAVIGFEALARWNHPVLGPLSPADFLPAAERGGRMMVLGEAVRHAAFRAFAGLRAAGLVAGAPRLAVNLSAAELASAECTLRLERALAEAGLSPDALEIEITEEMLLDRVGPAVRDRLAALRRRGARLALDDFGTGYAGLHQLLRLPLDVVKLDRCFVRGLGLDRRTEEIVRASVTLAHSLRLELLAEGVETEEQLARLRALGCDAVQGFLIARPMPPEEVAAWLTARRDGAATPTANAAEAGAALLSQAPGVVALRRREPSLGQATPSAVAGRA